MKKYKRVYIEITNVCNLDCHFCPKTSRYKKFLTVNEFKHIIKEIKPYTDNIFFHIMGEPLLSENLEEFLKISSEEGLSANITTNGTLINKKRQILLEAKSLKKISISLHSFEANDTNLSSNNLFNDYLNDILDFAKEASKTTNIITALRLWNLDSNTEKGENLLNSTILNIIKEKLECDIDINKELIHKNSVAVNNNIYINSAQKFGWPDINEKEISDEGFCLGLRNQFGILSDGTVVPCCLDSEGNIPLGNIFNKPLKDILEGDRATKMYQGFSSRKRIEKLCKTCGYCTRF